MIDYVANPEKARNGELISSYECDSKPADTVLCKGQLHSTTKYSARPVYSSQIMAVRREEVSVSDYALMYRTLFNAQEKAIASLQKAHQGKEASK